MSLIRQADRRKQNLIKSMFVPLATAVITGVGASYVATKVHVAVMQTRVQYLETDVVAMKSILSGINLNQIELARRGEWMLNAEKRIDSIERTQEALLENTKDRYTRKEAEKDYIRLMEKLNTLNRD